MKTPITLGFFILHSSFCFSGFAQGTAFTYQGRLNDGAGPAAGIYDLRFTIYDSASNPGGVVAGPLTNSAMAVSNGLFTVVLDFGIKVFNGEDRWLEIGVRPNGGTFADLSPRQPITPAPYAITASNLGTPLPADQLTGTLLSAQLSGTYSSALTFNHAANSFAGNGSGLTALNASQLASGTVPDARLGANVARLDGSATFLGPLQALGDLGGRRLNVGTNQVLTGELSSIAGGDLNTNGAPYSTIGGGEWNTLEPAVGWSFLGGGFNNRIGADAYACFLGSGEENLIADGVFFGTIAGGVVNRIAAGSDRSAIGGGDHNTIDGNSPWATIPGGYLNHIRANSDRSVIGGGVLNSIAGDSVFATIAGGAGNDIGTNAPGSVVSGGEDNHIGNDSPYAVIAGGVVQNIGTNSDSGTIGGGMGNTIVANGYLATIPGGQDNLATAYAFAAGFNARATNRGAFVWSDSNGTATGSTNNNSVTMRASGGYRFFTGTGAAGAQLPAGATAWTTLSDRNVKKDIRPADASVILDQLSRLPLSRWHYVWESDADPLNLGPMAQDFKAAFYPGRDDKTISTLEFDGVALAAIQGLDQKVEGRMKNEEVWRRQWEERLEQKEAEIAELKQAVHELKQAVRAMNQKTNGGER
jgi:hypothetical protein